MRPRASVSCLRRSDGRRAPPAPSSQMRSTCQQRDVAGHDAMSLHGGGRSRGPGRPRRRRGLASDQPGRSRRGRRWLLRGDAPIRVLPMPTSRTRVAFVVPVERDDVGDDGVPAVSVPVLSRTTAVMRWAISSASPPLIRMPASAPRPVPTMIAVGVASPSAHGHAMISTATKFNSAYVSLGWGPNGTRRPR